ncbi:MAG TPA: glutaminyl-peptide cyclotransferase [Polyangiaceae bacterium]
MISQRIRLRTFTKTLARIAAVFGAICGASLPEASAQTQAVRPELVATYPHDRQAFTQGLVVHEGKLYESTGLLGRSTLRRVVTATGAVEKSVSLASNLFGEGLALAGDRFFQLTWQNRVALTYDIELNPTGQFEYAGEGWGLCYDGRRLVMSDGSSRLFFRNPTTFAVTGDVEVRTATGPVSNLNELECVGSLVYANVWQTDVILRIDPSTGDVLHTIDASGLLTEAEAVGTDVLNGIAYDPRTSHFFITGKLWPKLFEVRFPLDPGAVGTNDGGRAGTGGTGAGTGGSGAPGESGGSGEPESPPSKRERARSACGCDLAEKAPRAGALPWLFSLAVLSRRRRSR